MVAHGLPLGRPLHRLLLSHGLNLLLSTHPLVWQRGAPLPHVWIVLHHLTSLRLTLLHHPLLVILPLRIPVSRRASLLLLMPVHRFHTALTLHGPLVLARSRHLLVVCNLLVIMISVRHFHVLLMHSVLVDFLLFVLLNITLYGLFLGLHSLDIRELSQICKGLLVVLADAVLGILDLDASGMSLLRSAPFPVVLRVHEFPLGSNTLLWELSILCLALILREALLNLRAKGGHLVFLFRRHRGDGVVLLR